MKELHVTDKLINCLMYEKQLKQLKLNWLQSERSENRLKSIQMNTFRITAGVIVSKHIDDIHLHSSVVKLIHPFNFIFKYVSPDENLQRQTPCSNNNGSMMLNVCDKASFLFASTDSSKTVAFFTAASFSVSCFQRRRRRRRH